MTATREIAGAASLSRARRLSDEFSGEKGHSGHVTSGTGKTADEPCLYRVAAESKYHWGTCRHRLRDDSCNSRRDQNVNPQSDEFVGHLAETGPVRRRTILVTDVSSFDVAEIGEPATERVKDRGRRSDVRPGCRHEKPDRGATGRRLRSPGDRRESD
jgi:hypothetical protein